MAIQRSTLDADTSFDPKTLIILARAFDAARPSVAARCHDCLSLQAKRDRLAWIVLDLGRQGERDVETLKSLALQRLNKCETS
jgi:hypothetical protein